MGYEILLSNALVHAHASLPAKLNKLFTSMPNKEDISIAQVPSLLSGVKSVQWNDDFGLLEGKLTAIWLDATELNARVQNNTLVTLIEQFRDVSQQTEPSQRTLLLIYGDTSANEEASDIELCRVQVHYPCLHRNVDSLDDAALTIYLFMHGTLFVLASTCPSINIHSHRSLEDDVETFTIVPIPSAYESRSSANPTLQEKREMYREMLLVISHMDENRAGLVMSRYRNWRSLCDGFEAMECDVRAGRVKLNSVLFTGDPESCEDEEPWVRALFDA
ncbi:hypothetical protein V5O48_019162, partial [Marasmius crinis-equi]